MDFVLDLTDIGADRIFVIGELLGDYDRLINLLYQQKFGYKDILVSTGNFINLETVDDTNNSKQLDSLVFLHRVMNAYSVKGRNEFDFLRRLSERPEALEWLHNHPGEEEILNFIEELPLIIKISDYIYVVNAGLQPNKAVINQDPEAFYSIGPYDPDSRFYQFENPEQKSWYDFDFYAGDRLLKFCFGGSDISRVEVPAGYCLGRDAGKSIKALIFRNGEDSPIILES